MTGGKTTAQFVRQAKADFRKAESEFTAVFSDRLRAEGVRIETGRHAQWVLWDGGAATLAAYSIPFDGKSHYHPLILRADIGNRQPRITLAACRRLGIPEGHYANLTPSSDTAKKLKVEFSVLPDEVTACAEWLAHLAAAHRRQDADCQPPTFPVAEKYASEWMARSYFWSARAATVHQTSLVFENIILNWWKFVRRVGSATVYDLAGESVMAVRDAVMTRKDYPAACALRDWIKEWQEKLAPDLAMTWTALPEKPMLEPPRGDQTHIHA